MKKHDICPQVLQLHCYILSYTFNNSMDIIMLVLANLIIATGHSLLNCQEQFSLKHKIKQCSPAVEQHPRKPCFYSSFNIQNKFKNISIRLEESNFPPSDSFPRQSERLTSTTRQARPINTMWGIGTYFVVYKIILKYIFPFKKANLLDLYKNV